MMKPPKRTIELRQSNRQAILRRICLDGPISRFELSRLTDLSPGTVTNVTSDLLQDGILHETGVDESEGGRPRTNLAVNPHYGYLVGVDLGETHLQLELFDLGLHKLSTIHFPLLPDENTPEHYVNLIHQGLNDLTVASQITPMDIIGMGIGVPGVVEHNGNVRISAPMWKWHGVDLLHQVEARIGIPVYIDNGAKGMALAEAWFGAGRGVQDMVVILIGTGIGAGVITKGVLYRGATNSAGEWGHTKIVLDGRPCRCGSQGCLEAYAGAPGIITSLCEFAPDMIEDNQDQLTTIQYILDAYQRNDPYAVQALHSTARYLGAGLANLVNLFNPELIVMGGWVGMLLGESFLGDMKTYLTKYALPPSVSQLKIDLCQFGQDAICTGTACLVLEEFLSGNQKFTRRRSKNSIGIKSLV